VSKQAQQIEQGSNRREKTDGAARRKNDDESVDDRARRRPASSFIVEPAEPRPQQTVPAPSGQSPAPNSNHALTGDLVRQLHPHPHWTVSLFESNGTKECFLSCDHFVTHALVATLERRGIRDAASWISWCFPTVEGYEARLRQAGLFREAYDRFCALRRCRPECAGGGRPFLNPFCAPLLGKERDSFLDKVSALHKPVLRHADGKWTTDTLARALLLSDLEAASCLSGLPDFRNEGF
jgi:hypothetical protein